jgi:hypothetical protein
MEFLFEVLSTLKFRPRLFNVRILQKPFQQNRRLFVRRLFLIFASDRERHRQTSPAQGPRLFARRDRLFGESRLPRLLNTGL